MGMMIDAARALAIANLLYIGSVVLAAIATVLVWCFGNHVSAEKDAELKKATTTIAVANARADEARADAARAVEGQKKLELEAERARLSAREIERQDLELQSQVEKEHIERLRLEERVAPRRLSTEQKTKLTAFLKPLCHRTQSRSRSLSAPTMGCRSALT